MEHQVAELSPLYRFLAWYEANRRNAVTGAVIVCVVGFAVAYYVWTSDQKKVAAGEALTDLLLSGGASESSAQRVERLLKLAESHKGSSAAGHAILQAATTLFANGKFAEAQVQYQRFLTEFGDHPFASQAKLGVAAALESQDKLDEAARQYRSVLERSSGVLKATAHCGQGRILEAQGKLSEALTEYEEAARADNGLLGNEARLRASDLKQKLPPVTATNAVSAPTASVSAPTVTPATTNTP